MGSTVVLSGSRARGASRRAVRVIAAMVVLTAALTARPAPAAEPTLAQIRFDDPVLLTGADAGSLAGAIQPNELVAFAWVNDAWSQIPVQVDERHVYDLRAAYPPPDEFSCAGGVQCYTPPSTYDRATGLWYSDPGTLVGADPDATLDADDEIALMARDTGTRAPLDAARPAGVVEGSGAEVRITDDIDVVRAVVESQSIEASSVEGFVYLFQHDGSLDPSAGKSYVQYSFNLYKLTPEGQLALDEDGNPQLGGQYPQDYRFQGGPIGNPEETILTTPYYSRTMTQRWVLPELRIKRGDATGVDIHDRTDSGQDWMLGTSAVCLRHSGTYTTGEGAFVVNRAGPIRVIRDILGSNSGPLVQFTNIFYDTRQDIYNQIRVHAFYAPSGYIDMSEAAIGMTFKSPVAPQGVTVDGIPDPVPTWAVGNGEPTWSTWDGPQGGLTIVRRYHSDVPDPQYSIHYRDVGVSRTYCSGDDKVLGAVGYMQGAAMPTSDNADDATTDFDIEADATMYFDAPGQTNGLKRQVQRYSPMTIQAVEYANRVVCNRSTAC